MNKLMAAAAFSLLLAGGGGKIQWRPAKQHDASLAEAKVTGMPIMIYFSADW